MLPASFGYLPARSVEEALTLLAEHGEEARLLAGGHSLIPAMKLRLARPRFLIDVARIPGLSGIRLEGNALIIGALTVHADIGASTEVRARVPALAEAALEIGDVQVRNRGTIGGSIAHADPGADFPVILTALNASLTLRSRYASRSLPAEDFFVDFFTTAMEPGEMLTEITVPVPGTGAGAAYAKLRHPASGYVVVSAGALIERDQAGNCAGARIAIGGLAGAPWRAAAVEAELRGKPLNARTIAAAAARAADGTDPEGDTYASAEYKRHMAGVYARKAVEAAVERAGLDRS
jgi:carbon-monoxide dehydrogenase medium subunit